MRGTTLAELIGNFLEKLFKFLASLKLAVGVIIAIGVISAVGTFYEAKYDAQVAQKLVYHSVYMYLALALLIINLINVMIDRLPWKRHHVGFILAHIGIIILLLGSLVTRYFGIDGSMTFGIGEANQYVTVSETDFRIWSSFGDGRYAPMHKGQVDFLVRHPKKYEYVYSLGSKEIVIKDYYHFAQREAKIVKSDDKTLPPAIRVQLESSRVNMTRWLMKPQNKSFEAMNLGPAILVMSDGTYKHQGENELVLVSKGEFIEYEVYSKRLGKRIKKGRAQPGDVVQTGWMDIKVRFINHYPHAKEEVTFTDYKKPGEFIMPAILFEFDNKEYWLAMNSSIKLFTDSSMYVVDFGNRRIKLDFNILLKKFTMGTYQGTNQPASYSSDVYVPELGDVHISMNNPMKHKGFTFYQASYTEDEMGKPVASILSVNQDPGRPWKYLGSFLIVLGSLILFYFKRLKFKKSQAAKSAT